MPWYEVIFTVSYRRFVKAANEDQAEAEVERSSGIVLPEGSRDNPNLDAEIFVRSLDPEYVKEHRDEPWMPFSGGDC